MIASAPWYASATLWTAVGTIAAVVGIALAFVTWRIGPPRRRLIYGIHSSALLLSSSSPYGIERSQLRVIYGNHNLSDPCAITLTMRSKSRRDIDSSDFDQSKPIVFDVGAPIVSVLDAEQSFPFGPRGGSCQDSLVQIFPTLIRKDDYLTLDLLIDGPPTLTCHNPLANVVMRDETVDEQQGKLGEDELMAGMLGAVAFTALAIWVAYQIHAFISNNFSGYELTPAKNLEEKAILLGLAGTLSVGFIIWTVISVVKLVRLLLVNRR